MNTINFLLLCTIAVSTAQDLSGLIKEKCPSTGQEASTCYGKQINDIIVGVAKGYPSLKISPMDPLMSGLLNLSVSAGSDQYRMNFLEPKFTGLSRARVSSVKVANPLEVTLHVPRLVMTSPYLNSGRLILIQASGGGFMTNTFDDVTLVLKVGYGEETRDERRYGTISSLDVNFSAKKSRMHVDKLNSGNAIAQELYNVFLSASSGDILGLMLPQMNRQFSELFLASTKKIVANLPLESVFIS